MSGGGTRIGSQRRVLGELIAKLRPRWRSDANLPARIERLVGGDRRFGSRDRRLYRELIFAALRYLPWVEPLLDSGPDRALQRIAWLAAETPATKAFRAELCAGLPPCPERVADKAAILGAEADALLPEWLRAECPEAFGAGQREALLSRPPLWVRMQSADREAVLAEFAARGWPSRTDRLLPNAAALPPDADVSSTEAYRRGRVEIQDIGSQLVLESVGVEAGGRWLDACAGAGGKTLQLAVLLGKDGSVEAHDIRSSVLEQLDLRARRAGLAGRITVVARPDDGYDGVLVDAPCSGSGTWRRSPHLKWVTTRAAVLQAARRQSGLLAENAARVRPGGMLVYATCSLCRSENEGVVDAFSKVNREFDIAAPGLRLWPAAHNGDGFYVAALRRLS